MNIESTLTRNQYMKLNYLMIIRQKSFSFFVALSIIFLIFGLIAHDIKPAVGFLLIMILVFTISILYMGLSAKNKNFFLKRQFIFNDESVSEKSSISDVIIKWEAFINWKKIAGYYLLYLSSATLLIIPKADIPASEITAFENLLDRKINISKSGMWTWKIKVLLTLSIVISVGWLLISFAGFYWRGGQPDVSGFLAALIMFAPVAVLMAEFCFILYGKRLKSRTMTYISSWLLILTMIGMLVVMLDVLVFDTAIFNFIVSFFKSY